MHTIFEHQGRAAGVRKHCPPQLPPKRPSKTIQSNHAADTAAYLCSPVVIPSHKKGDSERTAHRLRAPPLWCEQSSQGGGNIARKSRPSPELKEGHKESAMQRRLWKVKGGGNAYSRGQGERGESEIICYGAKADRTGPSRSRSGVRQADATSAIEHTSNVAAQTNKNDTTQNCNTRPTTSHKGHRLN